MPFQSLREFLAKAEQQGQLLRISEEVRPEPDIRTIAYAAAKVPQGPVVLFEKIQGYGDKKVVMNVHGSWENHALSFDLPKDTKPKDQFIEIARRWDRYPVPPVRVEKAPVKDVIIDRDISKHISNQLCYFSIFN